MHLWVIWAEQNGMAEGFLGKKMNDFGLFVVYIMYPIPKQMNTLVFNYGHELIRCQLSIKWAVVVSFPLGLHFFSPVIF